MNAKTPDYCAVRTNVISPRLHNHPRVWPPIMYVQKYPLKHTTGQADTLICASFNSLCCLCMFVMFTSLSRHYAQSFSIAGEYFTVNQFILFKGYKEDELIMLLIMATRTTMILITN